MMILTRLPALAVTIKPEIPAIKRLLPYKILLPNQNTAKHNPVTWNQQLATSGIF
jgi:hypothetical protein